MVASFPGFDIAPHVLREYNLAFLLIGLLPAWASGKYSRTKIPIHFRACTRFGFRELANFNKIYQIFGKESLMLSHDEQQRLAAIFNRGEFDALEM